MIVKLQGDAHDIIAFALQQTGDHGRIHAARHCNDDAGVFGGYGVILQLIQGIPVQRPIVLATLERLSLYTGHPYDLENVKVALAEETREKERETNFA